MGFFLIGVYALFALVALSNLLLMRRPKGRAEDPRLCVLIPARNEAENLRRLIPALMQGEERTKLYVFDDESDDGTGEVAASLGAVVIRPAGPLPEGWTGKNRACHELALAATEDCEAPYLLFLDADVYPQPGFLASMRALCAEVGPRVGAVTGFPRVIPGRGVEPLFLGWVGWSLLSLDPFGLVCRTGGGHNRFLNGQVQAWRREVYTRLWPNEAVKERIMEDVMMGRLLAKEKIPVETANLSGVLAVHMYDTWRQTLDGMSKNAYEVTNSTLGCVLLAAFFLAVGWGWLLAGALWPWALGLLLLSGLGVGLIVRAPLWLLPFAPVMLSVGAFTVLRSLVWRRRGQVRWKGRIYDPG